MNPIKLEQYLTALIECLEQQPYLDRKHARMLVDAKKDLQEVKEEIKTYEGATTPS